MEKPTYLSSTFSILTLIVVVGLTGLCIWLKDVTTLKEVTFMLLGGYGFKKAYEMNSKDNLDKKILEKGSA